MGRLLFSLLPCILSAQVSPVPAHIQAFQATAKAVRRGGMVTVRWSVTGADQVRLDPLGLILPARGEITQVVPSRMVYWLHVTNAAGGQSAPLVVEVLPEETIPPGSPAPFQGPQAMPPAPVPPGAPPLVPAPPRPALTAVRAPAAPRTARRLGPRTVWIQFATTASPRGAARLQRTLLRVAAADSTILLRNRRSGRAFQLVRTGPFPSLQAARQRLRELATAMHALKIRPIILIGPAQPLAPPS